MKFISIVKILVLFFFGLLVVIYVSGNSYGELPLKMGCSASSGWNPWEITYQRKIFEDNNLKLKLVWFDSYHNSVEAMVDGKVDVNCQTLNETVISATKQTDQVIVLINHNSLGNNKVIAREEVQAITDLKDKKIAVELGSVDHFLLLLGLKDVGLSQRDIKIQSMSATAATDTFYQGELDAIGVPSPYTNRALERPGSKELLSSENYPGAISGHLVVTQKLINEKPQVVQALINSWYKTLHYMQANPTESYKIMAKRAKISIEEYQNYDTGMELFGVKQNLEAFAPKNNIGSLPYAARQISKFLLENGSITKLPDLTKLLNPQFVKAYAQANRL